MIAGGKIFEGVGCGVDIHVSVGAGGVRSRDACVY